jgi:hypothetical protein
MVDTKQFNSEVMTLRSLWGNKSFWANENQVQTAKKAIGVAYLNCVTANEQESDQVITTFMATMSEFLRRAAYMGVEL